MEMHANLFYVGDQDFESKVLKADKPVIVDFWAERCPPCRAIAPVFERLSDDYKGQLTFAKMDVDASEDNNRLAARLGIHAIPTLLVFKGGQMIGRISGVLPTHLKNEIDRILANDIVA